MQNGDDDDAHQGPSLALSCEEEAFSNQIDVVAVVVIKIGHDLIELVENFVVTGHVGSEDAADDALTNTLVHFGTERGKQVGRWVLQNIERHRTVVVFQRRYVVVTQCQLRPCIYLHLHATQIQNNHCHHHIYPLPHVDAVRQNIYQVCQHSQQIAAYAYAIT